MQKTLLASFVLCALWVATPFAQTSVTVQLRDGGKIQGRIEELTADGTLFVRVSKDDQRRIPISSVALIDHVGGASGLPDTELREATGSQHLLLLTSGNSVKGQLVAIRGGQGSAQESQAQSYVFRSQDGNQQAYPTAQVARVYTGNYPFAASTGNNEGAAAASLDPGVDGPGSVRVPATAGWVSTQMRVRQGDIVTFSTSGEVQLSTNSSDRARAAGSPSRTAAGSPLPNAAAGALIGRIGNGPPFGIGDQTSIAMPNDGLLYLGVNDDELADNSGAFVVRLGRSRR
jgi:hypothetical protein